MVGSVPRTDDPQATVTSDSQLRVSDTDTRAADFAALTYLGQLYYADRIAEGASHDSALSDARYSYGTQKGKSCT